jgi:hypothetical protein
VQHDDAPLFSSESCAVDMIDPIWGLVILFFALDKMDCIRGMAIFLFFMVTCCR